VAFVPVNYRYAFFAAHTFLSVSLFYILFVYFPINFKTSQLPDDYGQMQHLWEQDSGAIPGKIEGNRSQKTWFKQAISSLF
jgi:hypothetical protein